MSRDEMRLRDALAGLRNPLDLARLLSKDILLELATAQTPVLRVGRTPALTRYLPPPTRSAQVEDVYVQHVDADMYVVGVTVLAASPDRVEFRADITARVTFRNERIVVICDYTQPKLLFPTTDVQPPRSSSL